jgi:hypothetical protein
MKTKAMGSLDLVEAVMLIEEVVGPNQQPNAPNFASLSACPVNFFDDSPSFFVIFHPHSIYSRPEKPLQ